jgi:hypothetical protein
VEDAPVDEEATLAIHGPSLSMVEDNPKPRLVEDPLIEIGSSSSTRSRKDEDLACPSLAPPSPSTITVRHRQSTIIARHFVEMLVLHNMVHLRIWGLLELTESPTRV